MMGNSRLLMNSFILFLVLFVEQSCCSLRRSLPVDDELGQAGGVIREAPKPRIINGQSVDDEDRFPYFVLLARRNMCGGVLIGPDLVLSAGHCKDVANEVNIGLHDRSEGSSTIDIEEQIVHPDYSDGAFGYDIMIVKLKESSDSTYAQINPEPTIPEDEDEDGNELTVIGFGDTTATSEDVVPTILQEAQVEYVNPRRCRSVHGSWMIQDDMLCAYGSGTDACFGDSGGPIMIESDDGIPDDDLIVGLVSWGRGCASGIYPGVYARISYFYDWIVEVGCEVSDDPPPFCFDGQEPSNQPSTEPSEQPSNQRSEKPSEQPSSTPTTYVDPDAITNPLTDFVGWEPSEVLQRCQGDCDNDDECEGDLICDDIVAQSGTGIVYGCEGVRARAIADYCIRIEDIPTTEELSNNER